MVQQVTLGQSAPLRNRLLRTTEGQERRRSRFKVAPSLSTQFPPIRLLVLQPTPFCNLNCDYCYLPDRGSKRRLSLDTLTVLFQRLFASSLLGSHLSVVWHAGEPLVMPLSFYDAALQTIEKLNEARCVISHAIQTNGTLITPAWCEFIQKHDIHIGVSIDGPAFLHDSRRKTRSGKGTHDRAMQGISLLQQHDIDFHVIAVLTQQALDFPEEIFDFFVSHNIHKIGFNIEEAEGVHTVSSLQQADTEERYRRFLETIYRLAKDAKEKVTIREFERAHNLIRQALPLAPYGKETIPFNDQVLPYSIITVDCDGNFSTFSPELLGQKSEAYGDFMLGNILTESFASASATPRFHALNEAIAAGVRQCRNTCEYFELCGGGAPANKYFEHGSFQSAETMYCRYGIQTPIDIILNDLESTDVESAQTTKIS
jgi:uncharacterized protein